MTLADVNWPGVIEEAVPLMVTVLGTIVVAIIVQLGASSRHKKDLERQDARYTKDLETQLEKEREISRREANRAKAQLGALQRDEKRQQLQANLKVLKSLITEAESYSTYHDHAYYRERLKNLRAPIIALGNPRIEESLKSLLSAPTPQNLEKLLDESKKAIEVFKNDLENL